MSLLNIDYEEMHQVAKQFEQRSQEIEAISTRAKQQSDAVVMVWGGASSQAFHAEMVSCQAYMRRVPGNLLKIARVLHETANIVRDAEERAQRELAERMARARWH